MATTLTIQKLVDTTRRTLVKVVGSGGGTNDLLIDAAKLAYSLNVNNKILGTGTDRKSSYGLSVKRISGQAQIGSNKIVTLQWADDTNSPIVTIGNGFFDYNFDAEGLTASIHMLPNANATGNILISSSATTGDAWTILIDLKKDGRDYDQGQRADPDAFNWYTYEGTLKP